MTIKVMIDQAKGEQKAELVFKNASMINVYSGEIEVCDIAVADGKILGIGHYSGHEEIDLRNQYIAPGFIDGHVHIESSMLTPSEFARIVLPKGTTTIIADPHEIANVSGIAGIKYMLKSSEKSPLSVYMMLPSCVPATALENAGATILAEDLKPLINHPFVLGLGEVMDYPAVLEGEASIHEKISLLKHKTIDGHAPDMMGNDLNAYIYAGVETDHECTTVTSMLERIKRGMYVHLREGSATKNVRTLLKGVTKTNSHRLLFCTDDKHPHDIQQEGHINFNINLAIQEKIDPVDAIRMATLNIANCYGLKHLGAIAPGKDADLVIFNDINNIEPTHVYKRGILVAKNNQPLFKSVKHTDDSVCKTMHIDPENINFDLFIKDNPVRVIGLIKNNITTEIRSHTVNIDAGKYVHNPQKDLLKIAVLERHKNTGNIGIGLVEGFGIKNGAIAMSIAHDSHNIITIGDSDEAMLIAVKKLIKLEGGIVLVRNNQVIDYLQLEIAGIITNQDAHHVEETLKRMNEIIHDMGLSSEIDDPFITLSFLSLPVIPELKLTDRGLFDVNQFKFVTIEEN